MNQRTHFAADALLPHGQSIDVGVNAWIGCSGHGSTINPERAASCGLGRYRLDHHADVPRSHKLSSGSSHLPTMDGLAHRVDRYLSRRVLPRGGPAALGGCDDCDCDERDPRGSQEEGYSVTRGQLDEEQARSSEFFHSPRRVSPVWPARASPAESSERGSPLGCGSLWPRD